jgi:hypothetical protein
VELAGKNIEIDFIGPLAEAQKRIFKSRGINTLMETILPWAQIDQEILDNIDRDALIQEIGAANSVSPKIVNSQEKVDAIRAKRKQEQMAMAAAQMATEAAKAVPSLNQPVQAGSPLEAMDKAASEGAA